MEHEYLSWFAYAENDLRSAKHLTTLHPQPIELICYLSQQCFEKYLKGYLVYQNIAPPKTHDLVHLCTMCMEFSHAFEQLFDMCELLSDYAVQPKYPNEMQLFEHHAQKALACAQQIKAFAPLRELREKLSEENS